MQTRPSVKNLKRHSLSFLSPVSVHFTHNDEVRVMATYNNDYRYSAFPIFKDGQHNFIRERDMQIIPLETKGMKFLILCPEEISKSNNPLFLLFDIGDERYKYTIR